MTMNEIKQSVAEGMMLDALKTKNISDKVYELVGQIVDECIKDIESQRVVVPDNGGKYNEYEAWYDNFRDRITVAAYESIQALIGR